jgi:DNA mismatch repair protein MutS2
MIYPQHFESKTGFDKIRQMLFENCVSPMGKEWVEKLKFSSNHRNISLWLNQSEEMKDILLTETSFPTYDYFDLRPTLESLKQKGSYIQQKDLFDLFTSLKIMADIQKILNQRKDKSPEIKKISDNLFTEPELFAQINQIIDDKGEIKDRASEELFEIRSQLRKIATQ